METWQAQETFQAPHPSLSACMAVAHDTVQCKACDIAMLLGAPQAILMHVNLFLVHSVNAHKQRQQHAQMHMAHANHNNSFWC